jgi:2-dehydro-3-deoxyphosphooctonate aldolase (KDO 8-P synthase)
MDFELNEIEEAHLSEGEDEALEDEISLLQNSEKIFSSLAGAYQVASESEFSLLSAMKQVSDKMRAFGSQNFMLTERGTTFGYQDLVVDFRGVPTMQQNQVPVVVDITHSLQQPNQSAGVTGGRPDMIETIGRAAIAVGADGIFMETHPDPARAKSDGANMLRLDLLEGLLTRLTRIREVISEIDYQE